MEQSNPEVRSCLNCGSPLPAGAHYCPTCGQKDTDGRITIGQVFSEFFSSLFNLEYSIFPTLRDLFIPGKLTIAYFEGKHKSYVSPIRIFFILTLLLIATIGTTNIDDYISIDGVYEPAKFLGRDVFSREFTTALDTSLSQTRRKFPSETVDRALDTLRNSLPNLAKDDLSSDSIGFDTIQDLLIIKLYPIKIHKKDLWELSPDEIMEKYKVEGIFQQILIKQLIKVYKNLNNIGSYLIGKILWLAILMLPVLALFMKLLYIRRKFFYVEHLVFCYHTHAFLFLILSLWILFFPYLPPSAWQFILAGYIIYLIVAFKRFYKQGLFKTLFKLFILSFIYLFLSVTFLLIVLALGFILF
jgi:hypothetical protein